MIFCLRTQAVSLEITFFFCNLLIFPAFLGFKIACVGFLQTREASSVVGAASFCLLFSSSLFCCMTYLVHCKANTKWRQQKQWNGNKCYAVWTWMDPSVWVQRGGKSAINLKTPSESGEKHWADSCLCEGFQLSVILQIPVPADTIRWLSPSVSLQYMSSLEYWSISMFYSILYHWQVVLLPLHRWGRG